MFLFVVGVGLFRLMFKMMFYMMEYVDMYNIWCLVGTKAKLTFDVGI